MALDRVIIKLDETCSVSGLVQIPDEAWACYVLAHGAGAGMTHTFMAAVANGLANRNIATLRFQFPYMETGSKRPDRPPLAQAAVRAAVAAAARLVPGLPAFAGGKSFGARMTSQAQALAPLQGVRGLVFFGFPLHPANKPSDERARHLTAVGIPMLFLQGNRDALAAAPPPSHDRTFRSESDVKTIRTCRSLVSRSSAVGDDRRSNSLQLTRPSSPLDAKNK